MANKKAQNVLDYLTAQGVEIPEDVAKKVTGKFEAYVLADTDSVLGDGQIAVNEASHKEKMEDLKSYKAGSKKFEGLYKETKDALDSGDSHNVKLLEKYKTENTRLKDISERYLEDTKSRWEEVKESIPKELESRFSFSKKDGDELSEDQIFKNLEKYDEYKVVNPEAFGIEMKDGKPVFSMPRARKDGKVTKSAKDDEWRNKTPAEKIAMGYKSSPFIGHGGDPGAKQEESD